LAAATPWASTSTAALVALVAAEQVNPKPYFSFRSATCVLGLGLFSCSSTLVVYWTSF
jgi:hypothetical protein